MTQIREFSETEAALLLRQLEATEQYVFLDTSKPDHHNQSSVLFTEPIDTLRYHLGEDRRVFFNALKKSLDAGCYLAGWLAYEFLHGHNLARTRGSSALVAELGVYRKPQWLDLGTPASGSTGQPVAAYEAEPYQLSKLTPNMERAEYCQAIETILEYIKAGDTYQVNYTFKFCFEFTGSVVALYHDLRRSQPVPFGSVIKQAGRYILSFSPELFFRMTRGSIKARPMKGTVKRGRFCEEDERYAELLKKDVKNRSENVMIVDLLRNDLSRLLAETGGGTVQVASLFDIEKYRSVLQMTSSITAIRRQNSTVDPAQILSALFPCGSVTGAPKIRTMEIIDELEKEQRGVYTGAIGYFSPHGEAVFNVPIRTVVIEGNKGEMGIGSGIVSDSSPDDEWSECLLKATFLTDPLPAFDLIETMFYDPAAGVLFEQEHLERLALSAQYFNIGFVRSAVLLTLHRYLDQLPTAQTYRLRLTCSLGGKITITHQPCQPPLQLGFPASTPAGQAPQELPVVAVGFAAQSVDSSDRWLFHKTTQRQLYDGVHREAVAAGLFDSLFLNERHEVTEGCISNVFIQRNGGFYTPPVTCGLLGGVMRRKLLESNGQLCVAEKVLTIDDLHSAERIYLCNSIRGVLEASLANQVQ